MPLPQKTIKTIHKSLNQAKRILAKATREMDLLLKSNETKEANEDVLAQVVAEKNGVSNSTIRRHCQAGAIPGAKKVGGKWRLPHYTDLGSLGL